MKSWSSLSKKTRKNIKFTIKSLVGVVLIAMLAFQVDWGKLWAEFSRASVPLLLVATALYVAGIYLCVHRWWRTALYKGFSIDFTSARRHYFAGLFLNNFLPSFLGGDAYQSYVLGKPEKRYAAAFSSVMFVRFAGLVVTILLFILFGLLAFKEVFMQPLFATLGLSLFFFLLVDVLLFYARRHFHHLYSFLPEKIRNTLNELGGYTDRRFLLDSVSVSAVFAIVGVGLFNMAIFRALGSPVPVVPYLSVVFLISVIQSLPISVSNIGLKEWAYYSLLPHIGIDAETALAVALLGRFIQVLVSVAGAPVFFRERREYGLPSDMSGENGGDSSVNA